MVRAIMFPTDFSAVANSALPLAATLAQKLDAQLLQVHVMHGGDPHVTETSRYEFPALPAEAAGVRVEQAMLPQGPREDPADVLVRAALERGCELIVMASHGRSDVAQFFLGRSVAEQVARRSRVPAIVVRLSGAPRSARPVERLARLLYVTDLTRGSQSVLPVAAAIARATGARFETLCTFGEGDVVPADVRAALEKYFRDVGAADLLDAGGAGVGGVAESIVGYAAAREVDLIALTTALCSGGDPRASDMAEYIMRNAPCPVLCVRP